MSLNHENVNPYINCEEKSHEKMQPAGEALLDTPMRIVPRHFKTQAEIEERGHLFQEMCPIINKKRTVGPRTVKSRYNRLLGTG